MKAHGGRLDIVVSPVLDTLPRMAVAGKKRLGEVLAYVKARQDQQAKPKVKTNSETIGYVKRGRKPGPRADVMNDPAVHARRKKALMLQDAAK